MGMHKLGIHKHDDIKESAKHGMKGEKDKLENWPNDLQREAEKAEKEKKKGEPRGAFDHGSTPGKAGEKGRKVGETVGR